MESLDALLVAVSETASVDGHILAAVPHVVEFIYETRFLEPLPLRGVRLLLF